MRTAIVSGASCAIAVLALTGCSFLVNFDELQKGGAGGKGAGGSSGSDSGVSSSGGESGGDGGSASGGTAGAGGTDAGSGDSGPHCATDCADTDPCTVDSCTSTGCQHVQTPGVVDDGLSETVPAQNFYGVTLMARSDRFYLSALRTKLNTLDVELHDFGKLDAKMNVAQSLVAEAGLKNMPVSAISFAPGTNLDLVGYVALGTAIGQPATAHRMRFSLAMKFQDDIAASTDANYVSGPRVGPIAWVPGSGEVWGAWPGVGNGIYLHSGTATAPTGTAPTIATASQVVALSPVSDGTTPGVLFVSDKPYVQAMGQALPTPIGECDKRAGAYAAATSAYTSVNGVWIGAWTKVVNDSSVVTEELPIICGSGACIASLKCSTNSDQVLSGVYEPAFTFASVQGDPPGRIYEVLALPTVDIVNVKLVLQLEVIQLDFDTSQTTPTVTTKLLTNPPIELASVPLTTGAHGPEFPAIAYAGPATIAVAWTQKETNGETLHVERKRLCLPKN